MVPAPARRRIVVFDLGGVLLQWNPRFLYRKLFDGDEAAMEHFLATVCTEEWNERQDAGRSFADAVAELVPRYAGQVELIEAFGKRFDEMVSGVIDGTVDIVADLKHRGVPLYALSNWSAETFPPLRARFAFLASFDGIVVSGEEGVIKPDPRIFRILLELSHCTGRSGIHRRRSPQSRRGRVVRHARHPLSVAGAAPQ
jgi:2-haloacid dehalogenase